MLNPKGVNILYFNFFFFSCEIKTHFSVFYPRNVLLIRFLHNTNSIIAFITYLQSAIIYYSKFSQ